MDEKFRIRMEEQILTDSIKSAVENIKNQFIANCWSEQRDIDNQKYAKLKDIELTERKLKLACARLEAYNRNPIIKECIYHFEQDDGEYIKAKKEFDLIEFRKNIKDTENVLISIKAVVDFLDSDACQEIIKANALAKKKSEKKQERAKKE